MDVNEQLIARKRYLEFDPENLRLNAEVIELAIKCNEIDFAWVQSLNVINNLSVDQGCLYWAVHTALIRNEYDYVVNWLKDYVHLDDPEYWILHNYCYAALRLGLYDNIISLCDNDVIVEKFSELILFKAKSLHFLEEYEKAKIVLKAFLDKHQNNPEALGLLGLVYIDLGELSKAKRCAEFALSFDDSQIESLLVLATVKQVELDFVSATSYVEKVLSLSPKMGRALILQGQLQLNDNMPESAILSFKEALSSLPNHIGSWHGLAWSHMFLDQLETSRECFSKALELNRNFAESHGGLAIVDAISGDISSSRKYLSRALRIDKNCFSGLFCKALLLRNDGQEKEADDLINKIFNTHVEQYDKTIKSILITVIKKRDDSRYE